MQFNSKLVSLMFMIRLVFFSAKRNNFLKGLNNTAFSLLEVLLAAIIFIVSIGGIFATLNAVRTPVANKGSALTAAVFGKQVLEALRSQVTDPQGPLKNFYNCQTANPDSTCGDFALSVGPHEVSNATLNAAGITWPPVLAAQNGGANPVLKYTVTCGDGNNAHCNNGTDLAHRVDLNICLDASC